jgi:hypothetical protein
MISPPNRFPLRSPDGAPDRQAGAVQTSANKADRANSRNIVNLIVCEAWGIYARLV